MLRRLKEDVETLPEAEETIIEVELTTVQKKYYRAIYEKNTGVLQAGIKKKANMPRLVNLAMELRKCCNHPYLTKGVEDRHTLEITESHEREVQTETTMTLPVKIGEAFIKASGKLVLLDKLLPHLKEGGHKVLIFSQFKMMLELLMDYLRMRAWKFEVITGAVTGNSRQQVIDRFQNPDSDSFIMLLTTRAGGVGINLTAADTVIIYDSDWNPQNDLQAQARCHRIGQTKEVTLYRLLARKTYEMEMFNKASRKLGLDQAILTGIRGTDAQKDGDALKMEDRDVEDLLKYGAYDLFKEEREGTGETESEKFCEADITNILNNNTRKVKGQDAKTKKAGNAFSKATFVAEGSNEDVDMADPEFWTRVVGLEEAKPEGSELILDSSRAAALNPTIRYNESEPEYDECAGGETSDLDVDHTWQGWEASTRDAIAASLLRHGLAQLGRVWLEAGVKGLTLLELRKFVIGIVVTLALWAAQNELGSVGGVVEIGVGREGAAQYPPEIRRVLKSYVSKYCVCEEVLSWYNTDLCKLNRAAYQSSMANNLLDLLASASLAPIMQPIQSCKRLLRGRAAHQLAQLDGMQRIHAAFFPHKPLVTPPPQQNKLTEAQRQEMVEGVQRIIEDDCSEFFRVPVIPEEAPGYAELIKTPMDLETIKARCLAGGMQAAMSGASSSVKEYNAWSHSELVGAIKRDFAFIHLNCQEYNKGTASGWIVKEAAKVMRKGNDLVDSIVTPSDDTQLELTVKQKFGLGESTARIEMDYTGCSVFAKVPYQKPAKATADSELDLSLGYSGLGGFGNSGGGADPTKKCTVPVGDVGGGLMHGWVTRARRFDPGTGGVGQEDDGGRRRGRRQASLLTNGQHRIGSQLKKGMKVSVSWGDEDDFYLGTLIRPMNKNKNEWKVMWHDGEVGNHKMEPDDEGSEWELASQSAFVPAPAGGGSGEQAPTDPRDRFEIHFANGRKELVRRFKLETLNRKRILLPRDSSPLILKSSLPPQQLQPGAGGAAGQEAEELPPFPSFNVSKALEKYAPRPAEWWGNVHDWDMLRATMMHGWPSDQGPKV
jgi:superfamily II DNA or RNA helicase